MSTITNTARRVVRHPATRTIARCVAACAVGALRTALRPEPGATGPAQVGARSDLRR
ncbi:hypothetical protein HLB23_40565 [Nocardia uniformis]|uniref:Uncharacterized protein n=1 Tax=Nocardia uniformis TaxID=53432 RepID=A0A849CL47_9NOCA|nr:hypothetical protein [Nocardia uniformis]NNH76071.1 hypothetical protein [Nocardia uniformis]